MEGPKWHTEIDLVLSCNVALNIGTSDGHDDLASDTAKGFWYWTTSPNIRRTYCGPYRTKEEAEKARKEYLEQVKKYDIDDR